MASLTVRNIPDDAKLRFRQVAAAHGRSMEEHLRQLVLNAGSDASSDSGPTFEGVRDVTHGFRHQDAALSAAPVSPRLVSRAPNWIDELIRLGQGLDIEIPPRKPEKLREIDFG
jgi:plasmid stability protein